MSDPPTRPIRRWFASRGSFFYVNALAWLGLAYLAWTLWAHRSTHPKLFDRYSLGYFGYAALISLGLLGTGLMLAWRDATFNRRFFCAAAFVGLTLELFLAFFGPSAGLQTAYRTSDFHHPQPYVMFTGRPGARLAPSAFRGEEQATALNALGFKGEPPALPKPTGELRVFLLGGSTVFNGSASSSLAGRLQAGLRAAGYPRARVYNWGAVSYTSAQELALLVHVAADYRPDLVISYDGGNDLVNPQVYDPRPGYPYNFLMYETALKEMGADRPLSWHLLLLARRSRLLSLVFGAGIRQRFLSTARLRRRVGFGTPAWERETARRYVENVRKMRAVCRGFGFRYAAFLQPVVYLKNHRAGREARQGGHDAARVRRVYAAAAKALGSTPGLFWVDLSRAFEAEQAERFLDFIHLTPAGRTAVARRMTGALVPWLKRQGLEPGR